MHDLEVDALFSITNPYAFHPMVNIIPETAFIAFLIGMCVRDYAISYVQWSVYYQAPSPATLCILELTVLSTRTHTILWRMAFLIELIYIQTGCCV